MTPSSGITSFSLPYLCCLVVVFAVVAVVVFVVVVATVGDPHRGFLRRGWPPEAPLKNYGALGPPARGLSTLCRMR